MKKVLCILLAGILIMAALPALARVAQPIIDVEGGNVTVSFEEGFNEAFKISLENYGVKEPIEKLTIAEGIKTINIITSLPIEEIHIPSTLESADGLPDFKNCSVAEESPFFTDIDGVLFSKDGKTLARYGALREDEVYTVPKGTEVIGKNAFRDAKVAYIMLPESVKEIGD